MECNKCYPANLAYKGILFIQTKSLELKNVIFDIMDQVFRLPAYQHIIYEVWGS